MPVFFFVGGFSNGVSWDKGQQRSQSYSVWIESRMRRLLGPVIPLIFLWAILGIIAYLFNIHPQVINVGSQVSLVAVWFLAIHFLSIMIVALTGNAWVLITGALGMFFGLALLTKTGWLVLAGLVLIGLHVCFQY